MDDKQKEQDSELAIDPLVKYPETNPDLDLLTNLLSCELSKSIVRGIKEAQTPEEIEKWLQVKEQFERQNEKKTQCIEQEKNGAQKRKLKIFDEIRLTVFSGLLLSLGISMVFLKFQQPGLVLIVIGSFKPLKYSLSEISGLSGKLTKNIGIFVYFFTLLSAFFAILIWADVSEGIQQSLTIFMSLIVLFSLTVIKHILETSNTIENILDRSFENDD